MGSDGGIEFWRVKDRARFYELVNPLEQWNPLAYSVGENAHDTWLNLNPIPKDVVWSFYGTDLQDKAEFRDLEEFIHQVREDIRTWEQWYLDMVTSRPRGDIERVWARNLAPQLSVDPSTLELSPKASGHYPVSVTSKWLKTRLCDWARQVKSAVIGRPWSVQTWT